MRSIKKVFAVFFAIMAVMLMNTAVWAAVYINGDTLYLKGSVTVSEVQNYKSNASVKIIAVDSTGATFPKGSSGMFKGFSYVEQINIKNANTKNTEKMKSMFEDCQNLTSLNISGLNTSKVTDMSYMFKNCAKLTAVTGLISLNTSNVIEMNSMFEGCKSLTSLVLSGFNTSNASSMNSMFNNCSSLTTLNVNKFDTRNVTNMRFMFANCSKLTTLDLSNFKTSNTTRMDYMFAYCTNLTNVDISGFDTSNVTAFGCMFDSCKNLISVDVSGFDTSSATSMYHMFYVCENLASLDVSKFDTSNVTNMEGMFDYCKKITLLDVSKFDTSNVTNMKQMFYGCENLTLLDLGSFDTSNVTNMQSMFYDCKNLTSLNLSSFNTSNVSNMDYMFGLCSNLYILELGSGFAKIETTSQLPVGSGWSRYKNGKWTKLTSSGSYMEITNSGHSFYIKGTNIKAVAFDTGIYPYTPDPQFIASGGKAAEPDMPANYMDLYVDGWYTDEDFGTAFDFNTAITEDMTLYAKWEQIDDTIIPQNDKTFVTYYGDDIVLNPPATISNASCIVYLNGDNIYSESTSYRITIPAKKIPANNIADVTYKYTNKVRTYTRNFYIRSVYKQGDIDGNGAVEKADAAMLLRHISDGQKITDTAVLDRADMDHNGNIDILDAIAILNIAA